MNGRSGWRDGGDPVGVGARARPFRDRGRAWVPAGAGLGAGDGAAGSGHHAIAGPVLAGDLHPPLLDERPQ